MALLFILIFLVSLGPLLLHSVEGYVRKLQSCHTKVQFSFMCSVKTRARVIVFLLFFFFFFVFFFFFFFLLVLWDHYVFSGFYFKNICEIH